MASSSSALLFVLPAHVGRRVHGQEGNGCRQDSPAEQGPHEESSPLPATTELCFSRLAVELVAIGGGSINFERRGGRLDDPQAEAGHHHGQGEEQADRGEECTHRYERTAGGVGTND